MTFIASNDISGSINYWKYQQYKPLQIISWVKKKPLSERLYKPDKIAISLKEYYQVSENNINPLSQQEQYDQLLKSIETYNKTIFEKHIRYLKEKRKQLRSIRWLFRILYFIFCYIMIIWFTHYLKSLPPSLPEILCLGLLGIFMSTGINTIISGLYDIWFNDKLF